MKRSHEVQERLIEENTKKQNKCKIYNSLGTTKAISKLPLDFIGSPGLQHPVMYEVGKKNIKSVQAG